MLRPRLFPFTGIAFSLLFVVLAGCPRGDWIGDPNSPCTNTNDPISPDPNTPTDDPNTPTDPAPLTTTGAFEGSIDGTYEISIDGADQAPSAASVGLFAEFDAGILVAIRPLGPANWNFAWVNAASLALVGDSDTVEASTNTSLLRETVALTSYDVNDERLLLTITMQFDARRGMNAEIISGTSTQTIEFRPAADGLHATVDASFAYQLTTQNPANPGLTTQWVEQFQGEGLAISP